MAIIKNIKITTEFITLQQLLKLADFINSGGEAKIFLQNHEVYVNGELDNRRGRKLYLNDEILIDNNKFKIC